MVAIYLAPVYLLVCVYILLRGLHWIQVLHAVFQNVWVYKMQHQVSSRIATILQRLLVKKVLFVKSLKNLY